MKRKKEKTELQKYFKQSGLKVKDVATQLNITASHLYKILDGNARPHSKTAKKLYEITNQQIEFNQIRKPLNKPKCPCCGRVLKTHHLIIIASKKRKEKIEMKEKKHRKSISLLDI